MKNTTLDKLFVFKNREFSTDEIAEIELFVGERKAAILRSSTKNDDDFQFMLCRQAQLELSLKEMRRLGFAHHSSRQFAHDPMALIEFATGTEDGRDLAERYGFEFRCPDTMFDVIDAKRDGFAVAAFIGDDRGWEKDWTYSVAVCWAPARLIKENGYNGLSPSVIPTDEAG